MTSFSRSRVQSIVDKPMAQEITDQIFISYSRKDEAFARKLAIWLSKTLSVGVWIDIEDIPVGIKWSKAIQQGLDTCHVMIVIVSPDSMSSINVEDEWQYFLDQKKPIVPVLLRSAEIPYQLRRIDFVDFSLPEEYSDSLRELVIAVRQHLMPMPSEMEEKVRKAQAKGIKTESRRSMKKRAEIKAPRRWPYVVGGLIIALVPTAILAYVLMTASQAPRVTIQFVRGPGNAQAILPGSNEAVALSSLSDLPPDTQIIANDDVIRLDAVENGASAVLDPNSKTTVQDFTETVALQLDEGSVSVDAGNLSGSQVKTPDGIAIAVNGSVGVAFNESDKTITTDCFEGNCTISDEAGKSRSVEGGQSITFSDESHNFDTAEITALLPPILLASFQHGAPELYAINPDGTGAIRLTESGGFDTTPAWIDKGRGYIFVSDRSGNREIYRVDADGQNLVNLTNNRSQDIDPAISPDSRKIAFSSDRDGNSEIYVMDATGENVVRLTNERATDTQPSWSPDGTQLVFVSTRDGGDQDIWVMNADGSEPVNLTNNEANDFDPTWSPDGTKIAYTSLFNSNYQNIFIMNPDGSAPTNISNAVSNARYPTWSPDSTRLLFAYQNDIYLFSLADPTDRINVTNTPQAEDRAPSWLPVLRAGL